MKALFMAPPFRAKVEEDTLLFSSFVEKKVII